MVNGTNGDSEYKFGFEKVWDYLVTAVLEGEEKYYVSSNAEYAEQLSFDFPNQPRVIVSAVSYKPSKRDTAKKDINVREEALDILVYDLYKDCPREIGKQQTTTEKEIIYHAIKDMIINIGRDKGRKTGGRAQIHSLSAAKNVIDAGGDINAILAVLYHDVTEERFDMVNSINSKVSGANRVIRGLENAVESIKRTEVGLHSTVKISTAEDMIDISGKVVDGMIQFSNEGLEYELTSLIGETADRLASNLASAHGVGYGHENYKRYEAWAQRWGSINYLLTRPTGDEYDVSIANLMFPTLDDDPRAACYTVDDLKKKAELIAKQKELSPSNKDRIIQSFLKKGPGSAVFTLEDVLDTIVTFSEKKRIPDSDRDEIVMALFSDHRYADNNPVQIDYFLRHELKIPSSQECNKLAKTYKNGDVDADMQSTLNKHSVLRRIVTVYKNSLPIEDIKRAVLSKLGDALDNVNSLEMRSPNLRIPNERGTYLTKRDIGKLDEQDKIYFLRLKELRKKTPFVRDHLEDFRNINNPKPVKTPKKIYALAKAFFVADCARLFMSYHDIADEPQTDNDHAIVSLLGKLTDAGAKHAYECAEEYKIRGEQLVGKPELWVGEVDKYVSEGGPRIFSLTDKGGYGELDGRLGPTLEAVRYKDKKELVRSILSIRRYRQSFLNIATLAESYISVGERGHFIGGVYPGIEEMMIGKRPDIFDKRPSDAPSARFEK